MKTIALYVLGGFVNLTGSNLVQLIAGIDEEGLQCRIACTACNTQDPKKYIVQSCLSGISEDFRASDYGLKPAAEWLRESGLMRRYADQTWLADVSQEYFY